MYTSQDAVAYLMDSLGGGSQDAEHRVLRQSVHHAYRDLVSARDWRWYETVDYLDIAASYVEHVLPWGVQSVDSFYSDDGYTHEMGSYVHPRDFQRMYDSQWSEIFRPVWTVDKAPDRVDRYRVRVLSGHSFTPMRATLTYRRRPRDLRITGYEKNSHVGSVDFSGVGVVGTGTNFTRQMVGAVVRVNGDPDNNPEPLTGIYPYTSEAIVYQVDSPTRMYAWSQEGITPVTGSKYVVTDMLDLAPSMYTALLSGAEVWSARLLGKNIEGAYGLYGRDLRLAFEADAVAVLTGRESSFGYYSDYWHLRPGVDQGVPGPGSGEGCPIDEDIHGGDADSEQTGEWLGSVSGGSASTQFNDCGDVT